MTIYIRTNKYKNRHLSMLHFMRKVLPCPAVYLPSCDSFCMHEESKDKEIMNPQLRAFRAVFFSMLIHNSFQALEIGLSSSNPNILDAKCMFMFYLDEA